LDSYNHFAAHTSTFVFPQSVALSFFFFNFFSKKHSALYVPESSHIACRMDEIAALGLEAPPGMDPMQYLLSLPALASSQIPEGADTNMTTNSPDQVWYLVVAIVCAAVPTLFWLLRMYTRLVIVRSLEPADCK
jgi:flagellar biosynthesis protein FliP